MTQIPVDTDAKIWVYLKKRLLNTLMTDCK